jgi:hypothetical protein
LDAETLRRKADELLKQARVERDPVKQLELLELAVDCLTKARSIDLGKKLN